MNLLNRVGKRLGKTAKTVTKKSEELVEITKINISIGNEKDKIKKILYEIGSEVYERYVKGERFGESLDNKCAEAKAIADNIEALKKRIKDINDKDNNNASGEEVKNEDVKNEEVKNEDSKSEEVKSEAKEQPDSGNEQEGQ